MNNLNIQKMFPAAVYRRGVSYYQNDQVTDLTFDKNHNIWTANVHGTEVYFVEVNLTNLSKGSIRAYCDCPAFHTYDSCKHIVAVLLSVANKTSDEMNEVNYEMTTDFIESISSI